jgi:hypothetical protein
MRDASCHVSAASSQPADPASHAAAATARRTAARERLVAWLLEGPAQRRDAPHAGAVAGVLEAADAPAYVYPEITGYYLQWLAWRACAGTARDALATRAAAAQSWLARWAADAVPRTRVYRLPRDDWRNGALFQFDIAMVLRGIAGAMHAGLVVPDQILIARLDALLLQLRLNDGTLGPCRALDDATVLPKRWSTRPGAFLAKAAAGVLAAARLPGVSPALVEAARRTLARAQADLTARPHDEAHPLLYAIEGVLARADDADARIALRPAAAALDGLLATRDAAGYPREHVREHGQRRNDVLAQALRAGCVLAALGVAGAPARATLVGLADALVLRVTPAGAVAFRAATATNELNVWAAMFSEQALAFVDLPPATVARAHALIV